MIETSKIKQACQNQKTRNECKEMTHHFVTCLALCSWAMAAIPPLTQLCDAGDKNEQLMSQSPLLQNGGKNTYLRGLLWGLSESVHVKCSTQHNAQHTVST